MANAIAAAIGDAVLTFTWMICSSMLGLAANIILSSIGIPRYFYNGLDLSSIFITTFLIFILVFVFNLIADILGGASFNPAGNASFYAAGVGNDTLFSMALRFPAQAAGAAGGTLTLVEFLPKQYKSMVGGPSLQVDLHTGAIAEGVLTFLISFCVLVIMLRGPRSSFLKNWLLAVVTVVFVVAGSAYTGPSMNPANAFGWAYLNNWHNTWEHFYVYWICPFIGAILAAWVFRVIFPPQVKLKEA